MFKLSDDQKQLIETVASDITFLQEEWGDYVTDHSLRRGSVILRRLLVEGHYQRAWKLAGFEKEPTAARLQLGGSINEHPACKPGICTGRGS